jgi:hypothetical protein
LALVENLEAVAAIAKVVAGVVRLGEASGLLLELRFISEITFVPDFASIVSLLERPRVSLR